MPSTTPFRLLSVGRWLPISLPAVLLGCTAVPIASSPAQAQDTIDRQPVAIEGAGTSTDSRLMFEIMIAELAGRRGQLDQALAGYLRAYPLTTDPRVAERAARLAIYARAWPDANGAISRWLELEPDAGEALDLRAQVSLRQGLIDEAAAGFLDVVEQAEDAELAWEGVAAVLQTDPDPVTARAVADAIAAASPDSAEAQVIAAQMALAAGDMAVADAAIDRTLELAPGNPSARLLRAQREANDGDMDGALQTLAEARDASPDDPRLQLGEAQLLVEAGRIDEARPALERIGARLLEQGADASPDALLTVGLLSLRIGAVDEAERWFTGLLETGEFTARARYQLARISDQRGDSAAAVDRYDAVPPSDLYIPAQVRAAELRAANGDLALARERLQTLRANVPDPQVKPQLVSAEGRLLQQAGRFQAAIDVLTAGLGDFPGNSALLYSRALAADAAGDTDMLEDDLEQLIEIEPDNAHALNALGYHLTDNNIRLDEAATYIEKASSLLPDDPAITDSLGWLRYRQGRNSEAIPLLRQAWQALQDPEVARHLVEVLWNDGREDDARALHAEALEKSPDDEQLQQILDVLAQ